MKPATGNRVRVILRGRGPTLLLAALASGLLGAQPAPAAIQGINWFPIGPSPIVNSDFGGVVSGRATAVAVNPSNVNDVWLGTAGGGIWHSIDQGKTWKPMSDNQLSLAIGSLRLADCDVTGCARVYAGTGENGIRRDTYYGRGLLVGSVSGGNVSWQLRSGCAANIPPCYNFTRGSVNGLVLDPFTSGSSRVIYLSLSSGVTASASESTFTAPDPYPGGYGVYKSSTDGLYWSKLTIPGAEGLKPTDLEMPAAEPSVLFAGFLGQGIFRSMDFGATWCPLNPGIPRPSGCGKASQVLPNPQSDEFDHVEIALDPNDYTHLYATFGMCPDRLVAPCFPSVYESTDIGVTWTLRRAGSTTAIDNPPCPGGYSRYTHGLTVSPNSPGTLFLGGVRLCKSIDHGQSWNDSQANKSSVGVIHPDHHMLVFHPTVHNIVYDANDGGLVVSADSGTTWTPRNQSMQTVGLQSVATSSLTARVLGGAQDNGEMLWTGGGSWGFTQGGFGDGGFSVMDEDDSMKMYGTTNSGPLSALTVIPMRSYSGGAFFTHGSGLIPDSQPRSFYPPLVQDPTVIPAQMPPQHPLYFGTDRLWRSVDDMASWDEVSPVLSTDPQTEIFSLVDVITAIAVAPSDRNRVYVAYYSGKVFVTDNVYDPSPSWFQVGIGLPVAPVTWLAVDPANKDIVYATLSGFFPGSHVWKKIPLVIHWFATGSLAELNGIAANSISIEPGPPNVLWLGTDKGVYKSLNNGGSWFRFSTQLPNVPVYQVSVDPEHNRVIAGTHGRGAFMLTGPFLSNFEGWVNGGLWSIAVYGHGFDPQHGCTLRILRQDSTVCAFSTTDALGGSLQTDANGAFATFKPSYYNGQPVAWACLNGQCLGGVSVSQCNQPGNPATTVVAVCGNQVAFDHILGAPPVSNPPSSWVDLTGLPGGFLAPVPEGKSSTGSGVDPELPASGSFQLLPAVQAADGSSHVLCSVNVPFTDSQHASTVLQNAQAAVNGDAACQTAGVSADYLPPLAEAEVEDLFAHPGNLKLTAPGVTGGQLIPVMRAAPGQATGLCFHLSNLGVPVENQLRVMGVRFSTLPGGALGADVTLTETSSLGDCKVTVPTAPGDGPTNIAAALAAALQSPGIPGPLPDCPSDMNPRDAALKGDALELSLASEIEICSNDLAVGVLAGPLELCAADADCNDGNPCTQDTCNVSTGQCQNGAVPNGLPCDDGNPCTVGGTCVSGACGAPMSCGDGNPCTQDSCDPAIGGCVHPPVICDDANICTSDICTAAGGCSFTPLVGTRCDDGNRCTQGDTCALEPGTGKAICQATPSCLDSDPCTVDTCDPTTGACQNPPLQCDDGDPCTVDSCADGACNASPVVGTACDDGNLCTTGDTCVGAAGSPPICQGQALTCDDDNGCTVDQCDAASGGCNHSPVPIGDVPGLQFTSGSSMSWPPVPGVIFYNTYRGTIPTNMLGSRILPMPTYDQTCFENGDANGDGALISTDTAIPALRTAFYYLVTQVTGCAEGPPGTDSDGTPRPNASPCPPAP